MSERKVIAKKAYVAIVRGYKILSSKLRTRQIFLVNTFLGRACAMKQRYYCFF